MINVAKQIPLRELPDTLIVRLRDTGADYDGEYLDPVTIEHVRFERTEALSPSAYKLADGSRGRIWIDAVVSAGAFEITKGAKVDVVGKAANMQVVVCVPYEIGGRVHHWEVDVK